MKRSIIAILILALWVSTLAWNSSRAHDSNPYALGVQRIGTTLPVSCANTRFLFRLTQVDGSNQPGLYVCNGSAYVPATSNTFSSATTAPSFTTTGTNGSGYLELNEQASAPSTPTNAARFFVDSSNRFSWKGENGFVRTFDGTANTANRVYTLPDSDSKIPIASQTITFSGLTTARTVTLPDANFTVARTDAGNTFTGNQRINGRIGLNLNPSHGLDIQDQAINLGGDIGNYTLRTNSTNKGGFLSVPPYVNAQSPIAIFYAFGLSTENQLFFGGGSGSYQAATSIEFYTASAVNTTSGTKRLRIDSVGDVGIPTQGAGLILRATDGANCFRVTVNNAGTLSTASTTCP